MTINYEGFKTHFTHQLLSCTFFLTALGTPLHVDVFLTSRCFITVKF